MKGENRFAAKVSQLVVHDSMIKKIPYILWLLFLGCSLNVSFSQSVSVRASVDRNSILIGEPIRLQLEASVPLNTPWKWFPLDSIAHFDFIERGRIDSVQKADHKIYKQVVTITSFDSGSWVFPALPMEANDKYYLTDSLPVTVSFSSFNPSQDYHDIKDILEVKNPDKSYINWAIAVLTLLSLAAVIYFLRKKKKKTGVPVAEPEPLLSPVDEAMRSLEQLKAQQLPEKGEVKLYYTRLTDILRSFILRKMKAATMQKTSEELILHVKTMDLPQDHFIRLAQTLRMSDAVKFAKFIPPDQDNDNSFQYIKTSIELLNNLHP